MENVIFYIVIGLILAVAIIREVRKYRKGETKSLCQFLDEIPPEKELLRKERIREMAKDLFVKTYTNYDSTDLKSMKFSILNCYRVAVFFYDEVDFHIGELKYITDEKIGEMVKAILAEIETKPRTKF